MRFIDHKTAASDYYALLPQLHAVLKPRTYVEIGFREGQSFALAKSAKASVAIDPAPAPMGPLPVGAKLFPLTSDEFFAQYNLWEELGKAPVDLAFIDGMHLFEFALRDFINLEKYCERSSTILVHDCYPIDVMTASRNRTTTTWSGDVWKLLICLKKYRPDLHVACIDIAPTGLGVIRNLNPNSKVLSESLEKIYSEFICYDFAEILQDKATRLNRVPNEWVQIKALFMDKQKQGSFSLLSAMRKRFNTASQ